MEARDNTDSQFLPNKLMLAPESSKPDIRSLLPLAVETVDGKWVKGMEARDNTDSQFLPNKLMLAPESSKPDILLPKSSISTYGRPSDSVCSNEDTICLWRNFLFLKYL